MRYQKVILFLVAASLVLAHREAESSETTPAQSTQVDVTAVQI